MDIMIAPFIACLLIAFILAYFGIHIIQREVIFVDLALAQIAALGTIAAYLFGFDLHGTIAYLSSLLFTFIGAAIFSLTRTKTKSVSQETIIGVVYAITAAASILVLDRIPGEAEHIKQMLVGNIIFVSWREIIKISILYFIISIFHFIYRYKFILISENGVEAEKQGVNLRVWDFMFYVSFGFVVTAAVHIAGVLLVFSYLIIPSLCASLFTLNWQKRLILSWIIGIFTSFAGLYFSTIGDLPTGACIICSFGTVLLVLALGKKVFNIQKG